MRLWAGFFGLLIVLPGTALADCDLDQFVGYTLVVKKTIEGYIDGDSGKKDGFSGCNYDRIIVFTDQTGVKCGGYGYSYAYRPPAWIWSDGANLKMCVGSTVYSVRRF